MNSNQPTKTVLSPIGKQILRRIKRRCINTRIPIDFETLRKSIEFVVNYNGELEQDKVKCVYLAGKKKREITVPTDNYRVVLKHFHNVISLYFKTSNYSLTTYRKTDLTGCIYESSDPRTTHGIISEMIHCHTVPPYDMTKSLYIKFDIQNAFPSTRYDMFLKSLGSQDKINKDHIEKFLVEKCRYLFVDDILPQGFKTSPTIFNYIQDKLISLLQRYISKVGIKPTKAYCKRCYIMYNTILPAGKVRYIARYMDDYLINYDLEQSPACPKHFYYLGLFINRFLKRLGYKMNTNKLTISHDKKRSYVRFLGHSIAGNNVKNMYQIPNRVVKKYQALINNKMYNGNDTNFNNYFSGYRGYIKTVKIVGLVDQKRNVRKELTSIQK